MDDLSLVIPVTALFIIEAAVTMVREILFFDFWRGEKEGVSAYPSFLVFGARIIVSWTPSETHLVETEQDKEMVR